MIFSNTIMGSVFVGTRMQLTATFTPEDSDVATDPSNVAVRARKPDGSFLTFVYLTAPEVTRTGVGVYVFRYVLAVRGRWWFAFEGYGATSSINAVDEGSVLVRQRATVAA